MRPPVLRGRWYDGHKPQGQPALIWLEPGRPSPRVHWHPVGAAQAFQRAGTQVGWPERYSTRGLPERITVDLREQGSLELDDVPGWYEAMGAVGATPTLAERMQSRWSVFAGVLLAAVLLVFAAYRWGTPWAAAHIARHVPLEWELRVSQDALRELDETLLSPSRLPAARRAELQARFDALVGHLAPSLKRYPGYAPRLELHFRRGLGANALALPGGRIVVTDGLVEAAARHGLGDDAIVGVLAHEIGHVLHRHTTRMVVEHGVINTGVGLALGDVSWLMSTGATLLGSLAYQRAHEAEADCFAVALMRRAQLPTGPMADLLLQLEKRSGTKQDDARAGAHSGTADGLAALLSTHPETRHRAAALKHGAPDGCP